MKLLGSRFSEYNPILKSQLLVYVVLIVSVTLVYFPGLYGTFIFDDFPNIVENVYIQINEFSKNQLLGAAGSYGWGLIQRPISMLSFSINYFFGELNPFWYKVTNLLIHIVSSIAVYKFSSSLIKAYNLRFSSRQTEKLVLPVRLAFFVTLLWALHPINLTSVLYVVQRMASLSGLFVFVGLAIYCSARIQIITKRKTNPAVIKLIVAIAICTPLAFLCKENGLLLPVLILVVERFFFSDLSSSKIKLISNVAVTVFFLVCLSFMLYIYLLPERLESSYQERSFSMLERVLTETRVIFLYVKLIVFPRPSEFALFHDDLLMSSSLTVPVSTAFSVIGLVIGVSCSILFRKKYAIFSFGLLFFLAAHLMESTVLPLEIMHEHRNYVASFSVVFFIVIAVYRLTNTKDLEKYYIPITTALILITGVITYIRANSWGDILTLAETEVVFHPNSPRSRYMLALVYWQMLYNETGNKRKYGILIRDQLDKAIELNEPEKPAYLIGLYRLSTIIGDIYTEEEERKIIELVKSDLAEKKPTPFTINSLISFFNCSATRECPEHPDELELIYQEIKDIPTLYPEQLAKVQASYANAMFQLGRLDEAFSAAEDAFKNDPDNIQHAINLAKLMLVQGHAERAKNTLDFINIHPDADLFKDQILNVELLVNKAVN